MPVSDNTILSRLANLLFICSKNQWRSPTAEALFKNHALHRARSAGTSSKARIKVNERTIEWADVIFVMERKHKTILQERFPLAVKNKLLISMNIKDDYQFMDEQLVDIIKKALTGYI
jgi:predicted protein tyrosine phosphatase